MGILNTIRLSQSFCTSVSLNDLNKITSNEITNTSSTRSQLTQSKSSSHINDLIIEEDLSYEQNIFNDQSKDQDSTSSADQNLMSFIEKNCSTVPRNQYVTETIHMIYMHYSFIEMIKKKDLVRDSVPKEISFDFIDFESLVGLLYNQDNLAAERFSSFVQSILYHIVFTNKTFSEHCFFKVSLMSLCSTLRSPGEANLNEICLILLKLIEQLDKKQDGDNYLLLTKLNETSSTLELELLENAGSIHLLSIESK